MSNIGPIPKSLDDRKPFVSLIIPTLNEVKNLPLVLPYIPLDIVDEVILVDGCSVDHTIEVAEQLLPTIKIIKEDRPGKGAALSRGYREASGDILIVIDADGSHDPREIPRFVIALMEGADFVKGTRFAPTGGTTDMPRLRKIGNWGFVKVVNLLFSQSFTDLCYGYHAFWRHCLDYLDLASANGFEVDTAIYLQAVRYKLKVVDVPSFEGFRFYGVGKLNTFPDGWRVLRTIFKEWIASLRQPHTNGQVGFRSYRHSPIFQGDPLIPVTENLAPADPRQGTYWRPPRPHKRLNLERVIRLTSNQQSAQERDRLLSETLLWVMESLGASSGSLLLLSDEMRVAQGYLVFGRRIRPAPIHQIEETINMGVVNLAIHNQQPILISNTADDPRWVKRPWEIEEGVSRSILVFPISTGPQVVGVLTLARPEDRPFSEDDLHRIKTISIGI